jgi:hypothetical protein
MFFISKTARGGGSQCPSLNKFFMSNPHAKALAL